MLMTIASILLIIISLFNLILNVKLAIDWWATYNLLDGVFSEIDRLTFITLNILFSTLLIYMGFCGICYFN